MRLVTAISGIRFNVSGAIDFSEEIIIRISKDDPKDLSFKEIPMLELYHKVSLPHMGHIMLTEFYIYAGKFPHISDRDTKVWYKCQRIFQHSHDYLKGPSVTELTLDDAINWIKKERFDIMPSRLTRSDERDITLEGIL